MTKNKLPKSIVYAYLAVIIANLIWAAAGPVIKLTVSYIPASTFLFLRFLIVCILILPYTIFELSKNTIAKEDLWKIVVLGLFAQSSIILIFYGLEYTTAIDAAIIGSLGVLMSMFAGYYFFNEKITTAVKFGLLLALVGSLFVVVEPLFAGKTIDNVSAEKRVWGNILVFLNNLAFLLYIVWSKVSFGESSKLLKKTLSFIHIKPMKKQYPSLLLMSLAFYVGLASMIPMAIAENLGYLGPVNYTLATLDVKAVLGLLFMALLSSIAAYFLFEWALNRVTVADTAILGYLSSIFAIPFAYWLLKEIPTTNNLIGAGIIALGVVICELGTSKSRK